MCFLRLTFKTACVIVGFLLSISTTQEFFTIDFFPRSLLFGKTNVTVKCQFRRWGPIFLENDDGDKNLVLDVRKNDKSAWITISESNTPTTNVAINDSADGIIIYFFHQKGYICYTRRYMCFMDIAMQVKFEECPHGPEIPTFRCRVLSGNQTLYTSEDLRLPIKGRLPKDIGTPTNAVHERLNRGMTPTFKVGDVLKLQCKGEIENSQSRENFRWCKSDARQNGKYEVISIQDEPVTSITSTSEDLCTIVQKSEIFYHISHEDVDLNITCELGYKTFNTKCGSGRLSGTLNIPTKNELVDRWQISPILIYDEDNMINSQRITLEGWGKTLTLLTTASVQSNNETTVKRTQWCVKKGNNSAWTRINLQEDKIDAMTNSTQRITIFSKITYHVTVLDSSVAFLFELSPSSRCASGDYFTNLKLLISEMEDNAENIENQPSKRAYTLVDNNIAMTSSDAWKTWSVIASILLVIMVFSIVLLLIVTHRRGEVSLFGFLLKTKRSTVVNLEQVRLKADTPIKRENEPKDASNELYENSEYNANKGNGQSLYLNVYKAGVPTTSQDQTYEEIQKQNNKPQEYEALKF